MLVVVLALIAVAVTAAVVIRDAHPPGPPPIAETQRTATDKAEPTPHHEPERQPADEPTQAVDMTQLVLSDVPSEARSVDVDAPTQSTPMPVSFAGAQAAAILPYPASVAEPIAKPAGFVPAGKPHLQPNPDRLIQTEIVIEDVSRVQKLAMTRLVIGMAASGAIIGLGVIGIGRGIALIVHALGG